MGEMHMWTAKPSRDGICQGSQGDLSRFFYIVKVAHICIHPYRVSAPQEREMWENMPDAYQPREEDLFVPCAPDEPVEPGERLEDWTYIYACVMGPNKFCLSNKSPIIWNACDLQIHTSNYSKFVFPMAHGPLMKEPGEPVLLSDDEIDGPSSGSNHSAM